MKWTQFPVPQSSLAAIPNMKAFQSGEVRALVSIDDGAWHLSISCEHRYPRWKELHDARYDLLPDDIYMAQILPPKEEYINVHPNCFHLWEIPKPDAQ